MFRNENKKINKSQAFTLVEALVAISILMIAIASPMTLAQKGLSTATMSKDQMIASFLAQDAIEAVKNIRDQIAISPAGGDWLNSDGSRSPSLSLCICDPSNTENCNFDIMANLKFCKIDTTASAWGAGNILEGHIGDKLRIYYSNDFTGNKNFRYGYVGVEGDSSSEDSKFIRYINIIKDPTGTNSDEAVVNVRVFWDSPQGAQKIDVQDFIYNYSATH